MDAKKLDALVRECQAVMVDYLRPDGIDADCAMDRLIGLLDGPQQREAQGMMGLECLRGNSLAATDNDDGQPYLNGEPFAPSELSRAGVDGQIGPETADRYALRIGPDGVYLADGRAIPSRKDAALGVDDGQLVAGVHHSMDCGKGLIGGKLGMHVEE